MGKRYRYEYVGQHTLLRPVNRFLTRLTSAVGSPYVVYNFRLLVRLACSALKHMTESLTLLTHSVEDEWATDCE